MDEDFYIVDVDGSYYQEVDGELHHVPEGSDGEILLSESYPVETKTVDEETAESHLKAREHLGIV